MLPTFSYMKIEEDPRIEEFLKSRELKEETVKKYLRHLAIYSEITGLTPSELIDQAIIEEKRRIELPKRQIGKHLLEFKEELENRNFSPAHIRTAITNVRTFYHEHKIELPETKLSSRDCDLEVYETIPTKEDIRKALGYANHKYKAIILLMVSSGMGATEIRDLTVEKFINSISECFKSTIKFPLDIDQMKQELKENKDCIATWNLYRPKTNKSYTTFSSPESVMAIVDYLERKPPETIKSPLFRSEREENRLTRETLAKYFTTVNSKCKFGKNGRQIFFRSHALRKYFATTLFHAGIKKSVVSELLGHRLDLKAEKEIEDNPEILLTSYQEAVESLTIGQHGTHRTESEDLIEIRDNLEQKDQLILDLKKEMELLKSKMGEMENQLQKDQ